MKTSPITISHDRLVELKPIEQQHEQFVNDHQTRYFIYEIDDNRWQNVEPNGETDYDLQSIKQERVEIPIGILTVDEQNRTFFYEGDLTVTQEDQKLLYQALD